MITPILVKNLRNGTILLEVATKQTDTLQKIEKLSQRKHKSLSSYEIKHF